MKKFCNKVSNVLRWIFGYGIMACLFAGGLTFFGYVVALCFGGDIAAEICHVLYKIVLPIIVKCSTILVLLGIVVMYLNGEVALTPDKKQNSKHEGEM